MYEILLVNEFGGFIPTTSRFFIAASSEEVVHQFTLDEERRSGMDVYLKPIVNEKLDLVLFTKVEVETEADVFKVNVFKSKGGTNETRSH